MICSEIRLASLCSSIIGDYVIFVEVDSTIYDDFNDFISNSTIYDKNDILKNWYDVSICINGVIQINVSKRCDNGE